MDLDGKTVLITGASSGLGLETSVQLARLGAEVVMVARDPRRGECALEAVRTRSRSATVSLLLCDLSSQSAIRNFAQGFRSRHRRLDVLVNNAGSMSVERRSTEDGLEQTFAVNHLAPFLLTSLLLDMLTASAPSRVVNVASDGHRDGELDFADLQLERGNYSAEKAYYRSKLANVLFTNELARRLEGTGVTASCLHPGVMPTNFWTHTPRMPSLVFAIYKLFMSTAEEGAKAVVHLATSPEASGGGYYEKSRRREPYGLGRDEALASRLWDASAKLVGVYTPAFSSASSS